MSEKLDIFDWHSTSLTFDNCGKYKLGDNLMPVLVLPTLDYFIPFLPEVEFPEYLIQHPDIWKSVFAEFTSLYEKAIDDHYEWGRNIASKYRARIVKVYESDLVYNRNKLIDRLSVFDESHELIDFHVHLKLWKDALEMLANRASKSVAIEFERWIYRHYLSDRFDRAMNAWWTVLNDTDSVPDCLEPMLDLIEGLNEGSDSIRDGEQFNNLYNKYYYEDYHPALVSSGYFEREKLANVEQSSDFADDFFIANAHRPPYKADAYVLEQAWKKTRVMPVLQLMARSLNSEQIETVVKWAEEFQASTLFLNDPTDLCGDELIITKMPFSDFPSVLDNPNL